MLLMTSIEIVYHAVCRDTINTTGLSDHKLHPKFPYFDEASAHASPSPHDAAAHWYWKVG